MASGPFADKLWEVRGLSVDKLWPIVVVGAPLGARFIATRSYRFVAGLLCSTIFVQFAGALLIVPQSTHSLILTGTTFLVGFMLFSGTFHKTIGRRT